MQAHDTTAVPLGVDWGRGNFKISGPHGTVWLPSHVAHANGDLRKADASIRVAQPQYIIAFDTVNGSSARYYVGHNAPLTGAPIEALDLSDYTGALDQRALLYAALTEYFRRFALLSPPECPLRVKVMVGVPQKALIGEEAAQRKSAIRQWLGTTHTWTATNRRQPHPYGLVIEKVGVASQAVGALFFYLTHPDRTYRTAEAEALLTRPLGILSLGSSTLELMAVQMRDTGRSRVPEVLPDLEGSYAVGAYHMLKMSNEMQSWSLGYRDQQFRIHPKGHDTALSNWLRQVQGHVNQCWSGQIHKDFRAVFVVGGMLKVPQVRDWARRQFQNAVLAGYDLGDQEEDCITAISQGLYRQIG